MCGFDYLGAGGIVWLGRLAWSVVMADADESAATGGGLDAIVELIQGDSLLTETIRCLP